MRKKILSLLGVNLDEINPLPHLKRHVIPVNSLEELKKVFHWKEDPILARDDIYDFDYPEDVNQRRVRDAESLAAVMKNVRPKAALEIGTSNGAGTALMAANAPDSRIYTVNIPPEEIASGAGGVLTTIALEKEKIGAIYRERGCANVTQIYANTATWKPEIEPVDVAFIDGCHDTDFVINDTLKILPFVRPGGFILWHDANPELASVHHWISDVCKGVDALIARGHLPGRIYWLRDSWICIWRAPEAVQQ